MYRKIGENPVAKGPFPENMWYDTIGFLSIVDLTGSVDEE